MTDFLGIGKTLYNSSWCRLHSGKERPEIEIFITERINRQKNSGSSPIPFMPISKSAYIAENSPVVPALIKEEIFNQNFPFFEMLESKNLSHYSQKFNPQIKEIPHHLAHAHSAAILAPFTKALVVVLDGAGSKISDNTYEHLSVYALEENRLTPLFREEMKFFPSKKISENFSNSIGIFYEMCSKYIFNSLNESGKVMGLAPFGMAQEITSYSDYLESLDWDLAFKQKGKMEWENSSHLKLYQDVAATAQRAFELFLLQFLTDLKQKYSGFDNLIFTGGCALNCTANWKIVQSNLFEQIYVPPNPGDESIGLGCAAWLQDQEIGHTFNPLPWEKQTSFYGPIQNIPFSENIEKTFSKYNPKKSPNICHAVAALIGDHKIVAWFQGRSECGPRALGHRSLLARPDRPQLKNYLNENIKFRESFRPYGCSVIFEDSHLYFEHPRGFHNPFMSYAIPVRPEYKALLEHVTHIDGTSRMQILHSEQDPLFHKLLTEVKNITGHGIVLNTSLNVMNEPILETIEEALKFFESSKVDALCIGDYLILKDS